ncbi:unnamed protein product [Haemonchus placei]|uniref:Copper transport protein n=1 Tax=Haemonchus placei TaxID=6290 RepID=A0A0N4VVB5_HAEPC|nr:unnamed protein product [Haemonchus placei]
MTGMMDMIIHFREKELILFSFWRTGTLLGMAVSMFISFLLCILYEGIKGLRLFLALRHVKVNAGGDQDTAPLTPMVQMTGYTKRVFSGARLAQAALYGIQALLAYILMLIVMTYNGNLILSIVVGEAVGYLLFTGTPLVDSHLATCC